MDKKQYNTNIVAYGRFPVDIDQKMVDDVAHQIDLFMDALGLTQIDSYYELVKTGEVAVLLQSAIDACFQNECSLLTFSLTTLHPDESTAMKIVNMLIHDNIQVYFVHAESTMKVLLQ